MIIVKKSILDTPINWNDSAHGHARSAAFLAVHLDKLRASGTADPVVVEMVRANMRAQLRMVGSLTSYAHKPWEPEHIEPQGEDTGPNGYDDDHLY
jgi:hypothetical protein